MKITQIINVFDNNECFWLPAHKTSGRGQKFCRNTIFDILGIEKDLLIDAGACAYESIAPGKNFFNSCSILQNEKSPILNIL